MEQTRHHICMIVPDPKVRGGIASVTGGYYGSRLEADYRITYVQSYCDGSKWDKLRKALAAYRQFLRILHTDPPELVHIHSSFGPSFYRKLPFIEMAYRRGIPVVNHIHGADFETFYIKAGSRKRKCIEREYRKCTRLIALSDEWKDRLSLIVPADRIEVVRNYGMMHEDAFLDRRERYVVRADVWSDRDDKGRIEGVPVQRQTVLFLGELGRRKGCYDLPDIIERVLLRRPGAYFLLCGAGSPEDEAAIRSMIDEKGLSASVEFPGWVREEEKDRILREADVFLLPSYQEGLPMSILDAMGYGLAIVSTCVGGIPELVQEGCNGYCCKPGDTPAIAEALCRILEDPDRNLQMGGNSLKILQSGFSVHAHLESLERIYAEVLG